MARCFVDAKARTNGINVVIAGPVCGRSYYPWGTGTPGFEVSKALKDASIPIDLHCSHIYFNYYPGELPGGNPEHFLSYWQKNQHDYSGLTCKSIWTEYGPTFAYGVTSLLDQRGAAANLSCLKYAMDNGIKEAWSLLLKDIPGFGEYFSLGYTASGIDSWYRKALKQLFRIPDAALGVSGYALQTASIVQATLESFIFIHPITKKYVGICWHHDILTNSDWVANPRTEAVTNGAIYITDLKRNLVLSLLNRNSGTDQSINTSNFAMNYGDFIYFEGQ